MNIINKLSKEIVREAAPKEKEYRLTDGRGLVLRVRLSGVKSWIFLFRLKGSRTMHQLTIGSADAVSLGEARVKVMKLRELVANGIDPRNYRPENEILIKSKN